MNLTRRGLFGSVVALAAGLWAKPALAAVPDLMDHDLALWIDSSPRRGPGDMVRHAAKSIEREPDRVHYLVQYNNAGREHELGALVGSLVYVPGDQSLDEWVESRRTRRQALLARHAELAVRGL